VRVKFFPTETNTKIAYFPDALRFFVVDELTEDIIMKVKNGFSYTDISLEYENFTEDEFTQITAYCKEKNVDSEDTISSSDTIPSSFLSRLVLNISNSCNMSCKYCYANGGTYGSENALMDIPTLKKILDTFYDRFDIIGVIQLFGGEPALNIEAIEFICDYIRKHEKITSIGMVTNGTILSEKLQNLIEEFNIRVTVSLDIHELQDVLRPFTSSENGTYEQIIENIKTLHKHTDQPSQIEVTYTKLHEDEGISVHKLLHSIYNDLGVDIPAHVVPVCTEDKNFKMKSPQVFIDSINDYFKYLDTDEKIHLSLANRYLTSLYDREISSTYCGGGIDTISISCNGDIYPCFYFTDNEKFKIGNVLTDNNLSIDHHLEETRAKYLGDSRSISLACSQCFANTVCFGCLGVNQSMTGNPFLASDFHCAMVKGGLEATLRNIVFRRKADNNINGTIV
jgi:uncharacterized protein